MAAGLELRAALLQLDLAAVEVSNLLDGEGISSILLKGPSFAEWLYEDRRDRLYTDVDILVPRDRLGEARNLLTSNGYRFDSDHPLGIHLTFYRHETNARVEVHSTLLGIGIDEVEVWTVLSGYAEPLGLIGREVSQLDEIGRALHVLLHAASDGEGHPLDDLERALDRMDMHRWTDVLDLADRLNARPSFVEGMGMAERGREILEELGLSQRAHSSARLRSGKASNATQLLALLAESTSMRSRWRIVRRALFPSPALMKQRYPSARKGRLGLMSMYVLRLFVSPIKALVAMPSWRAGRRS